MCHNYSNVSLDLHGHKQQVMFLIASLADWDLIIGWPLLNELKAPINCSTGTTTVTLPGNNQLTLMLWIAKPPQHNHTESKKAISSHCTTMSNNLPMPFNPFEQFPEVFPDTIPITLPSLREINHVIKLKDPKYSAKPQTFKIKECFLAQLKEKIKNDIQSGRAVGQHYQECLYNVCNC